VYVLTQLSSVHLKRETASIVRNVVFKLKDRTLENVRKCDNYAKVVMKH
jgi:hypothetical protein